MVKRTGEEHDCEPGEQPENREADDPPAIAATNCPRPSDGTSSRCGWYAGRGDAGCRPSTEAETPRSAIARLTARTMYGSVSGSDAYSARIPAISGPIASPPTFAIVAISPAARRCACGVAVEIGEVGSSGRDARAQSDAGQDPAGDDGVERFSRDEHEHGGDRITRPGISTVRRPYQWDVADQQQTRDETDDVHAVDDRGRQRRERVALCVQPVQRARRRRQRRHGQEGEGNDPERCSPRELRRDSPPGNANRRRQSASSRNACTSAANWPWCWKRKPCAESG